MYFFPNFVLAQISYHATWGKNLDFLSKLKSSVLENCNFRFSFCFSIEKEFN